MIAEQQFQRGASRLMHFFRFALHHHSRLDFCPAGGHQLAINFHQTHQARIQRPALFQVAEGWDVDGKRACGVEDALVRSDRYGLAIDGDRNAAHALVKSECRVPKAGLRISGIGFLLNGPFISPRSLFRGTSAGTNRNACTSRYRLHVAHRAPLEWRPRDRLVRK